MKSLSKRHWSSDKNFIFISTFRFVKNINDSGILDIENPQDLGMDSFSVAFFFFIPIAIELCSSKSAVGPGFTFTIDVGRFMNLRIDNWSSHRGSVVNESD